MLVIRFEDLFKGFIHSYWTFGIRFGTTNTKYTHKILGHFAQLGALLGFIVTYEWKRYDLTWFKKPKDEDEKKPLLHIEHENSASRLSNLMGKVKTSISPNILAIGYPISKRSNGFWVRTIEKLGEHLPDNREVLYILDPAYYGFEEAPIVGHLIRSGKGVVSRFKAWRYQAPGGTYYASMSKRKEKKNDP